MKRRVCLTACTLVLATGCGPHGTAQPETAANPASPAEAYRPDAKHGEPAGEGWRALDPQTEPGAAADAPTARVDVSFATSYVGKYPAFLIGALTANPEVDARLRALLGDDYQEWLARFEVAGPVERSAELVVAEGCMAHACAGGRQSMIVIDVTKNRIAVGMVTEGKANARSEDGQIPPPLKTWLREFSIP